MKEGGVTDGKEIERKCVRDGGGADGKVNK